MLRRFQISNNKSLDGVLDMLNSRCGALDPAGWGARAPACLGAVPVPTASSAARSVLPAHSRLPPLISLEHLYCCSNMTDAGPLDQIADEDSDADDLLPPTLAGGAAGASDLPGTGAPPRRPAAGAAVAGVVASCCCNPRPLA